MSNVSATGVGGNVTAEKGAKVCIQVKNINKKTYRFKAKKKNIAEESKNEVEIEKWNIPIPSQNFFPRKELEELNKQLEKSSAKNGPTKIIVLYGMSGIGKTEIVLQAAHNPTKSFKFIAWFESSNLNDLKQSYFKLGVRLKLFGTAANFEESIIKVCYWLENSTRTLLVYDNAKYEDYELIKILFPASGADILITSEDMMWNSIPSISVELLSIEESIQFIKQVSGRNDTKASDLADKLGKLPLALAQASAYIRQQTMTVSEYLLDYENLIFNKDVLPLGSIHVPVVRTWDISIRALEFKEETRDFLHFCAYVNSSAISEVMVIRYLEYKKIKEVNFLALLEQFFKYSLIKRNSEDKTFSIHKLLQLIIRNRNAKSKLAFNYIYDLLDFFNIYLTKDFYKNVSDWEEINSILIHVNELINHARNLGLYADRCIEILCKISRYYMISARSYTRAKSICETALEIYEEKTEKSSKVHLDILINIGYIHVGLFKYEIAERYLEKALELIAQHQSLNKEYIFERVDLFTIIGNLYLNDGNYVRALLYYEKAKNLYEECKIFKAHDVIGRVQMGIGAAHVGRRTEESYLKAKAYLINAHKNLNHYIQGENKHLRVAEIYFFEAMLDCYQLRYSEALRLIDKSIEVFQQPARGNQHPDTAEAIAYKGWIYLRLDRYEDSIRCAKTAIRIFKQNDRGNWGKEVFAYILLAYIFDKKMGKKNQAIALKKLKDALDLISTYDSLPFKTSILKGDHPPHNWSSFNPEFTEIKYDLEFLEVIKRLYGDTHLHVAYHLYRVAVIYEKIDLDKAKKYYVEAKYIIDNNTVQEIEGNKLIISMKIEQCTILLKKMSFNFFSRDWKFFSLALAFATISILIIPFIDGLAFLNTTFLMFLVDLGVYAYLFFFIMVFLISLLVIGWIDFIVSLKAKDKPKFRESSNIAILRLRSIFHPIKSKVGIVGGLISVAIIVLSLVMDLHIPGSVLSCISMLMIAPVWIAALICIFTLSFCFYLGSVLTNGFVLILSLYLDSQIKATRKILIEKKPIDYEQELKLNSAHLCSTQENCLSIYYNENKNSDIEIEPDNIYKVHSE